MSLDELARTSAASLLDATAARTDTVAGRAALGRTVQRRRVASIAAAGVAAALLVFAALTMAPSTPPPVPRPAAPTGPGGVVVHCGRLLCAVDPSTGAVQRLQPLTGWTSDADLAGVSPDGTEVAYSVRDGVEVSQLYGTASRNVPTGYRWQPSALWTSSGVTVARFTDSPSSPQLDVSVESNGQITQRTALLTDVPFRVDSRVLPSWSPDGTRLAFSAQSYQDSRQLYVIDENGQNVRQLSTLADGQVSQVSWSPDATRIAYVVWSSSRTAHLMVIDPNGSFRTDLGSIGHGVEDMTIGAGLAWSPDSQSVAFLGKNLQTPGWALYIRQLDGTTRHFDVPGLNGFTMGWAADSGSTP